MPRWVVLGIAISDGDPSGMKTSAPSALSFRTSSDRFMVNSSRSAQPDAAVMDLLALLRQILATRSCHRSSHRPTQVLTGQAQLAVGEAEEARRSGDSGLMRSFRRPRRPPSGTSQRRNLRGRHAAIADRDLSSPRSDAVMLDGGQTRGGDGLSDATV